MGSMQDRVATAEAEPLVRVEDAEDRDAGARTNQLASIIHDPTLTREEKLQAMIDDEIVVDGGEKLYYVLQRPFSPYKGGGTDPLAPMKKLGFVKVPYGEHMIKMLTGEDATANQIVASWICALTGVGLERVIHRMHIDDFDGAGLVAWAVRRSFLPSSISTT